MKQPSTLARLVLLAAVTLVGAGACSLDPQSDRDGAAEPGSVNVAEQVTGASGTPGPDPTVAPSAPASTPARPTETTAAPTQTTAPALPAGCKQGTKQREVETYLAKLGGFGTVTVDGKQSAAECTTIKNFQRRYDLRPVEGQAGPATADVARRLANTNTAKCQAGAGTTFCIDLTLQTVWAMQGSKVIMAPTVTRTGMAGFRTPTGSYTIFAHKTKEWSNPYEVWLPYWQNFTGGIGFHETTTYLHNASIGSHGCVNLLPADVRKMFSLGKVGTKVYVFGRRPGT
jgi:lipoprotein-anchoring transpeptidase ErfK/SrfK